MTKHKREEVRKLLEVAIKSRTIIQFWRPYDQGSTCGYVQSIGEKFFLLAELGDGAEFLSHTCLCIQDVRKLQAPAKHEAFYKAVRQKRGDKAPLKIKVDLTSSASILRTLHPSVVTIHREKVAHDTCIIGRTMNDNGTDFEFLEIAPGAEWESKPSYFRLKQITRIDLPGPYEKALLLVGGEPTFPPGTFS
jgi:hypothetical protein